MLVKYRIPISHEGDASSGIQFCWAGVTYRFNAKAGKLRELEVVAPNFPLDSVPTFDAINAVDNVPTLRIPSDPIWPEVERRLMFMEGAMALLGLRRLDFELRTTEWVPESEQEKERTHVFSFSQEKSRQATNIPIPYDMFARSLLVADELSALEIALNFNRRGRESLAEGRYIEAIFEFYFVLETMFADGVYKSKAVLRNYQKSAILVSAVLQAQQDLALDVRFVELVSDKVDKYLASSVSDVLEHLISVRGLLHHHSGKNKNPWHPRRQSKHHVDAIFLAQVCFNVLGEQVFSAMYSDDAKKRFEKIAFSGLNGERVVFKCIDIPET